MQTEEIALSRLVENEENPRTITDEKFKKLVKSLLVFPRMLTLRPIVVDETMTVLGGNMRLRALKHIVTMDKDTMRISIKENDQFTSGEVDALVKYWEGWRKKPTATIVNASDLTEAQKKEFIIKDNVGFGDWDTNVLANQWDTDLLKDWGMDDWDFGMSGDMLKNGEKGDSSAEKEKVKTIEERFLIPPFSILDTRRANWKNRRNYWISQGIKSEKGRGTELTYSKSLQSPYVYNIRNKIIEQTGKAPSWQELEKYCMDNNLYFNNGTSIFDPVLCECAYRWFMPDGGKYILDPFCGGSVRGIVASKCGYEYFGRDLRKEQIDENEAQCNDILSEEDIKPTYSMGDSLEIRKVYEEGKADLLFSCPPYANLEVYSNDPRDISNMKYPKFLEVYRKIIDESCKCLRDNRFAVWVVSEVRGKDGEYYGLVNDTIKAFKDAGLHFYNDIVLVNQVASIAIRVGSLFNKSRKVSRIHQNVLVFFKGDIKSIVGGYSDLDLSYLQDEMKENEELSE